ncbi:MAG: carbohydrate ABC transporter permease [Deinococcota bacterium]
MTSNTYSPNQDVVNKKQRQKKRRAQIRHHTALTVIVLFVMFPIFWITTSAFKLPIDVRKPTIFFQPTLQNFQILFNEFQFADLLLNSLLICVFVVLITLPLAAMGSYGLSRYQLPFKKALLVGILASQFFPPVVLVLPYFTLFRRFDLLDTILGLVIINLTRTIPFSIWLLKGFMDTLPMEIEESAMVDGCTEFKILQHIVLPLSIPGLITTGIFAFILAWNEFLYALLLTGRNSRTAIVGLVNVVGERDVPWEQMSAAGILVMIPMLIMAFAIRKYFVEGMTMGAVK